MKATSRSIAFDLLCAVELDDAYANLALPKLLKASGLDQRDTGLAQEIAFGTLRNQLFYDHIVEVCAKRSISKIDIKSLILLRIGAHQLLALRTPNHAAINETVNLAKRLLGQGSAGFVNGILRRISERDRADWLNEVLAECKSEDERLSVEYSHPIWIVRALRAALDLDSRAGELVDLLKADNSPPPVNLVALPGLDSDTHQLIPGKASPVGFTLESGDPYRLVQSGHLRVQDQGSQLAALVLSRVKAAIAGEAWLDLCAGPGGKAALLAAEAKLCGVSFIANEISAHRVELVKHALEPLSLQDLVICSDGRDFGDKHPEQFDRVLIDAPCTGLGALRRRPESRYRKQASDLSGLTSLQQELIASGFKSLKVNGYLLYVTCSPHVAESVGVVDWLLRSQRNAAKLLDANEILSKINPQLELNPRRKTAQLWPHVHATDAMFIALIQKVDK